MAQDFADHLRDAGLEPAKVKLLRHDRRGLEAWNEGRDFFLSFASIQSADSSPFKRDPEYVAHFLPGPRLASGGYVARFVGLTRLHGRWPWTDERTPRVWLRDYRTRGKAAEAADQSWEHVLEDEVAKLEIDWGIAPRSWHQWANQSKKPIIGLRDPTDLQKWAIGSGTSLHLSEEEADRILLDQEERDLAQAIGASPNALNAAFDDRRSGTVQYRPDQFRFRKLLLGRYGQQCAMSDCNTERAMEAAHIIPFSEGHRDRNTIGNGLLLRRDLHRLFDLLMVSVDPSDRTVWVNASLRETVYGTLHGSSLQSDCAIACIAEHFRRSVALAGAGQ